MKKIVLLCLVFSFAMLAFAQYNEAPMLAEKVAAGELPSVADRLPANPLVIEPVEEVGEYGGTWRYVDNNDGLAYSLLAMPEGFVKWTRDAQGFRPNLLEEWSWNEDSTVLTAKLREGIKWSDGDPLTVDDYLFWWNDMVLNPDISLAPPAGTNPGGEPMQVEKIDDFTMQFTFAVPHPLFLENQGRGHNISQMHFVPSHFLAQFHPDMSDVENSDELIDRYSNPFHYIDLPTLRAWRVTNYVTGQVATFERNPYYWKVDTAGNQLPYIDYLEAEIPVSGAGVNNEEVLTLKAIAGELDAQFREFDIRSIPLLLENQESGDYRVIMWRAGNISRPLLKFQYAHKDEGLVDLVYNQDFRIALSQAINRERLNDVIALGLGEVRQMALLSYEPWFQDEAGKALYDEWTNSYIEYDTDLANSLLDGLGLIDVNGDGFRERADGTPLEIVADIFQDTGIDDAMELIKQDWEAVGIKTVPNRIESAVFNERVQNQETILVAWGGGAFGGLVNSPSGWLVAEAHRGGMCGGEVGRWVQTAGASGVAPRPGSACERLGEIYVEAIQEVDPAKRDALIIEAMRVHIEQGPLHIGTMGDFPDPIIVKNNFRNVPEVGYPDGWFLAYPGTADPEQFFFKTQ